MNKLAWCKGSTGFFQIPSVRSSRTARSKGVNATWL